MVPPIEKPVSPEHKKELTIEEYIRRANYAETEAFKTIRPVMEEEAERYREITKRSQKKWKKMLHKALPAVLVFGIHILYVVTLLFHHKTFLILSGIYAAYQAYLTVNIAFFQSITLMRMERHKKRDWKTWYTNERMKLENTASYAQAREEGRTIMEWNDIAHYIIMPNYKETMEVMQQTIQNIVDTCTITNQLTLVLAMEEREVEAPQKAAALIRQFREHFKDIMISYHPPNLPNDIPGKGSNERWATNLVDKHSRERGVEDTTLITIFDADSLFTRNYFECITAKFCLDVNERYYTIFQAPITHYVNLFQVPLFTKIMTLVVSMHEIASSSIKHEEHVPFSTYSLSLRLAQEVGGWDGDNIPEDWHMYIKCSMRTGGRAILRSVYLPVNNYSVGADTYWDSLKERWYQAKRHAWGLSEIAYYLNLLGDSSIRKKPLIRNLKMSYKLISLHVLAGTQWFYFALASSFCTVIWILSMTHPDSAYIKELMWYSRPFQFFNAVTLPIILFGLYQNTDLMLSYSETYSKAYTKAWSTTRKVLTRIGLVIWFVIMWNIGFGVAVFFYTYVPTLINCVKLLFQDNITYHVATKATSHSNLSTIIDSNDDSDVDIDMGLIEASSDEMEELV